MLNPESHDRYLLRECVGKSIITAVGSSEHTDHGYMPRSREIALTTVIISHQGAPSKAASRPGVKTIATSPEIKDYSFIGPPLAQQNHHCPTAAAILSTVHTIGLTERFYLLNGDGFEKRSVVAYYKQMRNETESTWKILVDAQSQPEFSIFRVRQKDIQNLQRS
jgi:hypothetical protein